jgi:Nuclease-related domain
VDSGQAATTQRTIAQALGRLADEQFVVLHDLGIPGSDANVDHLVIGPTGAFMIDPKCWTGKVKSRKGTLWYGKTPLRDECTKAEWEAQQMAHALGIGVHPIICFVDTQLPSAVQKCDDVTVCRADALVDVIRGAPQMLEPMDVASIIVAATSLLRFRGVPNLGSNLAHAMEDVGAPFQDVSEGSLLWADDGFRARFGRRRSDRGAAVDAGPPPNGTERRTNPKPADNPA